MRHPKLLDTELSAHMTDLPGWAVVDDAINRTYEFGSDAEVQKFLGEVNAYAEEMDHHPDLDTSGTTVTVTLTTHDSGGVTSLDFQLAQKIESAAGDTHAHPKDGLADTSIDPESVV